MNDDIAISVKKVSKNFKLPHERADSIKSVFVNPFNKNRKKVEVQHALRDISFDVKKGEFFGIVGRNGSGKSTLLKIIAGIYQPDKGSVTVNGKLVPFIELGVGFNPQLSGRENVYLNGALLGFSEKEVRKKYSKIVEFAELQKYMDQKLKNYSSGMQVRLAFSVATVLAESDILLIDEVLAVGDADFQRKCFNYFRQIKKQKKTVIFVSHDMSSIREYCDRAILIGEGSITLEGGVEKVANGYLKMFQSNKIITEGQKRWGSGDVVMEDIKLSVGDKGISIIAKIKAHKDADDFRLGYLFRDNEGRDVLGGSNINANEGALRHFNLKKGGEMIITISFPNILGNGSYWFDATVMSNNGVIYDKWAKMAKVDVFKDFVYYPVVAPSKLEVKYVKNKA